MPLRPSSMKAVGIGLLGVVMSGLALCLSLPPVGFGWLAWFALVPVLYATSGRRFVWGFVAGLGVTLVASVLAAVGLLSAPVLTDRDPGWIYLGFVLMGLVLGVVVGLWAEKPTEGIGRAATISAWAVLLEGATVALVPAHMALTQSRNSPMLALASVAGIWGVSYLVWFTNLAAVSALRSANRAVIAWSIAGIAVLSIVGALVHRPKLVGRIRVAVVQTEAVDPQTLVSLTRSAATQGAKLVVWPELGGVAISANGTPDGLVTLVSTERLPTVVSTYHDTHKPKPHNHLIVVDGSGVRGEYDKQKPFAGEKATVEAGNRPGIARIDGATLGLCVCFDVCYPGIIASTAGQPGVNLIVLPTLCPDTPHGVCQALHAAYVAFRCAEQGVAILRADVTGHSMVVDQFGTVLSETGVSQDKVVLADIEPKRVGTLYSVLGDWVLFACAAIGVAPPLGRWASGLKASHQATKGT